MGKNRRNIKKRRDKKRERRRQKTKTKKSTFNKKKIDLTDPADPMEGVGRYLPMSVVAGTTMPASTIVRAFSMLGWAETFKHLAAFGAVLRNSEGALSKETQECLRRGVEEMGESEEPVRLQVAHRLKEILRRDGELLIAHERVVFFLQGLAVHHCPDDGPSPTWGDLVLLMLACNDHLIEWVAGRDQLHGMERSIADVFVATRFDSYDVALSSFVRAAWLMNSPPSSWPDTKKKVWPDLHREAFAGMSFPDYFETFLGPLAMTSFLWGINEKGDLNPPSINPDTWMAPTNPGADIGRNLLNKMAVSRSELRDDIPLSPEGLPQNVLALTYRPLVKVQNQLWATSPAPVREQLRGGAWNQMREACASLLPEDGGSNEWLRAFGYRFEEWCQFVAEQAAKQEKFTDDLITTNATSKEEELSDVALRKGNAVALFEAKGTTVPARTSGEFKDARDVMKWFERFLFVQPKGNRRGGVIRQLHDRCEKVRGGHHAERVVSSSRIFPVVVTYENLGEHAILYRWIDDRCKTEGLLQANGIAPVTLLSVDDFQKLMGFGAGGKSVVEILQKKTSPGWREGRMDRLLWKISPDLCGAHIPGVESLYEEGTKKIIERLHGREPALPSS